MSSTAVAAASAVSDTVAKYRKAAAKERQHRKDRPGRADFLKMAKDGVWSFGKDNTEVEDGSLWAIHPDGYRFGWTCWTRFEDIDIDKKDKKLGTVMIEMGADPIEPDDLEEHTHKDMGTVWEWTECVQLTLMCMSGEDKGKKVVYNSSSQGGLDFADNWLQKFEDQLFAGEDALMAVVTLGHTTYNSDRWGKTYKPEFELVEWRLLPEFDTAPAPASDAPALEKPKKDKKKKKDKKAAKPEQEAAPEPTAPEDDGGGEAPANTRRRRRPDA